LSFPRKWEEETSPPPFPFLPLLLLFRVCWSSPERGHWHRISRLFSFFHRRRYITRRNGSGEEVVVLLLLPFFSSPPSRQAARFYCNEGKEIQDKWTPLSPPLPPLFFSPSLRAPIFTRPGFVGEEQCGLRPPSFSLPFLFPFSPPTSTSKRRGRGRGSYEKCNAVFLLPSPLRFGECRKRSLQKEKRGPIQSPLPTRFSLLPLFFFCFLVFGGWGGVGLVGFGWGGGGGGGRNLLIPSLPFFPFPPSFFRVHSFCPPSRGLVKVSQRLFPFLLYLLFTRRGWNFDRRLFFSFFLSSSARNLPTSFPPFPPSLPFFFLFR